MVDIVALQALSAQSTFYFILGTIFPLKQRNGIIIALHKSVH